MSNGGKRLTHRVSAARRIVTMSSMAWDPDTRPTRTTSRARRLPAHALRRISSTFCASDRRSGGASPRQALAWRCQRRRYGWATSAPVRLPSFHPSLFNWQKHMYLEVKRSKSAIGTSPLRIDQAHPRLLRSGGCRDKFFHVFQFFTIDFGGVLGVFSTPTLQYKSGLRFPVRHYFFAK